nr:hypothetical protein LBZUJACN_LBZUJACN_CDS_0054 [Caudoviricetes sp.]CAI9751088.1 hypothetical protein MIHLRAQX_MIHLRAQX_CDS_0054 [Caudoviricetes sp.]
MVLNPLRRYTLAGFVLSCYNVITPLILVIKYWAQICTRCFFFLSIC